jgi:hypothetical protein
MARRGLLEVHGDFRHPQTNLNSKPLTEKNQSGSNNRYRKLNLYAAQLQTSRDISWLV